jgi:DNA-binding winged helix-turn-helix (wHTH) protein
MVIRFDRFSLDRRSLELRDDGRLVPLQQQPARVLLLLLERGGELVTRDDLRRAIWGDETFVDFNRSLNFCVSQIRAALGDSVDEPRFIETLRGRGYRFSGIVSGDAPREAAVVVKAPKASGRSWTYAAAAAAVIAAPVLWILMSPAGPAPPTKIAVPAFASGSEAAPWSAALQAQIVAHLAQTPVRVMSGGRDSEWDLWHLDGRVDRSGEQYRVTVTLRDRDGTVRWSEVFDGPPGDWIEAQNEMARIITEAVRYNVEGPRAVEGISRRAPRRKIPFS